MGIHLNPGDDGFRTALRSKIYVDKTGLIGYTNEIFGTNQKFICVSRPRRFGKSMAADMLSAYYDRKNNCADLFEGLEAEKHAAFEKHRNRYNVIFLDMQDFLRDLLKDKAYVGLAYMTGILPVKKYGTHSALNMFDEFSMTDASMLAWYAAFVRRK